MSEFVFFTTQKRSYLGFLLHRFFEKTENCWDFGNVSKKHGKSFKHSEKSRQKWKVLTFFYAKVFRLTGLIFGKFD